MRSRHRDYYTALAALLDAPAGSDYEQRIEQADIEIDNLRAAFGWSRENSDIELALALASSLQPLWEARGRLREGLVWFDAALADLDAQHPEVAAAVRARRSPTAPSSCLWAGAADSPDRAQQALAIAREVDDPALLARALDRLRLHCQLASRRGGPARTWPRRLAWPGNWTTRGGSARSSPARRSWRSRRVTRSRCARPVKKEAISPMGSVTGSRRAAAAGASERHSG